MLETINANPLRRLRHKNISVGHRHAIAHKPGGRHAIRNRAKTGMGIILRTRVGNRPYRPAVLSSWWRRSGDSIGLSQSAI
jgi:hypothetical protein